MVKRNAIATKLTKRCTQTQKRAFDVAVKGLQELNNHRKNNRVAGIDAAGRGLSFNYLKLNG